MSVTLPLVSVVIPSFQQGRFIRSTLESVLTQDYPHLECLVMDGGSTDGTVEILKGYGDRISWVSETDGGQAAAVNKGWARSRGEILGWLNSDDRYTPGAVRRAVDHLVSHPETDAVYGEGLLETPEGQPLGSYSTAHPMTLGTLREHCLINQPTVFLRRAAVERLGGLRESLSMVLDYDLWLRLLRSGARMDPLPDVQAVNLMYPETKTARFAKLRSIESFRVHQDVYLWLSRRIVFDRAYFDFHDIPQGEAGAPRLAYPACLPLRAWQVLFYLGTNLLGAPVRLLRQGSLPHGDLERHRP